MHLIITSLAFGAVVFTNLFAATRITNGLVAGARGESVSHMASLFKTLVQASLAWALFYYLTHS